MMHGLVKRPNSCIFITLIKLYLQKFNYFCNGTILLKYLNEYEVKLVMYIKYKTIWKWCDTKPKSYQFWFLITSRHYIHS